MRKPGGRLGLVLTFQDATEVSEQRAGELADEGEVRNAMCRIRGLRVSPARVFSFTGFKAPRFGWEL